MDKNTTNTSLLCPVCETCPSNGKHFGIICCGACAAFFRRTVAEEKIFSCTRHQNLYNMNVIKQHNKSYRVTPMCRHCRYLKCLKVGMQLDKVQPQKVNPDYGFNELAVIENADENINKLVKAERLVEHERYNAFGSLGKEFKKSTMKSASIAAKTELYLIDKYFDFTGLLDLIPESEKKLFKRDVYFLWAQIHAIWLTHNQGGYSANRMCYIDRSYTDINEDSVKQVYSTIPGLKNVDTIVRLTMPMYFEFRTIVKMIQRYRIDRVEYLVLAQLSYINLAKTKINLTEKEKMVLYEYHKHLLKDLHKYHSQHYKGEEAVRFGNMTLLIGNIEQASRCVQEQVALLYLSGYKTTVDKDA